MNKLVPVLGGLLVLSTGLAMTPGPATSDPDITVSFYPMYSMTTELIEGTGLQARLIAPPGSEPHSFDPSPSAISEVRGSDVYIAAGAGILPWEQEIMGPDRDSGDGPRLVRADTGIDLITVNRDGTSDGPGTGADHTQDTAGRDSLSVDPHYWVNPANAVTMTDTIATALIEEYPEHADTIRANHDAYRSELEALNDSYSQGLADCRKDTILTTHAAYTYLARDYGFQQATILGLSPVSEPTPRQIQHLIDLAAERDLNYVFYEAQVDPNNAEIIADEIGAHTLSLDPVLGGTGDTYIQTMDINLRHLKTGLECR